MTCYKENIIADPFGFGQDEVVHYLPCVFTLWHLHRFGHSKTYSLGN